MGASLCELGSPSLGNLFFGNRQREAGISFGAITASLEGFLFRQPSISLSRSKDLGLTEREKTASG